MSTPEHDAGISRNPALNRFSKRNLFPGQVARAAAFLRKAGLPDLSPEAESNPVLTQRVGGSDKFPVIILPHHASASEQSADRTGYFLPAELLDKLLGVVDDAPEEEVKSILKFLLVQQQTTEETIASSWKAFFLATGKPHQHLIENEQIIGPTREYPDLAWVLNLIPAFPQEAIKSINAYVLANRPALPAAYTTALSNCEAIIRTRYLSHWQHWELFAELGTRNFELLVAFLYEKQGYQANLLTHPESEYADILATRTASPERTVYLIQCKVKNNSVGIAETKQLLAGVRATKSAKGIFVATSYFSSEARKLAASEQSLDLVDGKRLAKMLNDYLGIYWRSKVDGYISEQESRYVRYQ